MFLLDAKSQTATFAFGALAVSIIKVLAKQQDHDMSLFERWLVYHDDANNDNNNDIQNP